MIERLLASFVVWLLGAPIYLPWALSRLGVYKRWYLAPFIPPFSWRGCIQVWPLGAVFICAPFVGLLPLSVDARMRVLAGVSVAGILLALIMVVRTPRWAKAVWQRRLEDRYNHKEINSFIHVWRQMDFKEWGQLIETEEGLKQLVEKAGGQYRREPRPPSG